MKSRKEREKFVEVQSRFLSQPGDFEINPRSHKHFRDPEGDSEDEGDESENGGVDSYYNSL
jgi:hypothetical protein